MNQRSSLTVFVVAASCVTASGFVHAANDARLDDGLARTPPMGWNSWNRFHCDVSSQLIRETADAMVASGMKEAGYQYVVIDDCWQVDRGADGRIIADPARFPEGMKALADHVHAKGLKFGLYTDAGRRTCQGRPGSYGHEELDAKTYAEWGVDYVKIDWCNSQGLDARTQYAKFRDALKQAGRPIVFSICEWGFNQPWEWGSQTGHLWRTTNDISDRWVSMIQIIDRNAQYALAAGPGAWNDPDMLEVGNGGMTNDEYRAHFSMWAIMAAPLIAGNDLRAMLGDGRQATAIREILTNREVIAVDQDSLGVQGMMVTNYPPELQVWVKPLADGSRAVVLLNRASVPTTMTALWNRIGITTDTAIVHDLWSHENAGRAVSRYSTTVPSHGAAMLRIEPVRPS